MLDFAFDHLYDATRGYPNLSVYRPRPFTPQWHQFDLYDPNVVPMRLLLYLDDLALPYRAWSSCRAPIGSIYPIAFSWFDFQRDYVAMIPESTRLRIRDGHLRLVFYYHEGDHPGRMRSHLDAQCMRYGITPDRSLLISANSAAASIPNCRYFDDFECWFWSLNRAQLVEETVPSPGYDFILLSRSNKSWRACVTHDLLSQRLLDNSLWSYASDLPMIDHPADNPLECTERWAQVQDFLAQGPYRCDQFDSQQQNDHHQINQQLYHAGKLHIVLETHLDADGSGGSFITEKTYKCIKYRQPFVIVGTPGSLDRLRAHGYRVFDHVLDNSYDREPDNTKRWHLLINEIARIKQDIDQIWDQCREDVEHNARLFDQRPGVAVNNLMQEIACQS